MVKNLPASAGATGDLCLIPGLGRSPGGGHGNLLQESCLENPMDRGAWQATVCGVTKSQTRLSDEHFHFNFRTRFRVSLAQSLGYSLVLSIHV